MLLCLITIMKWRIQVFAVWFRESCMCVTWGLNGSTSEAAVPSRSVPGQGLARSPTLSASPFPSTVLQLWCIHTKYTYIHWCSTIWHSAQPVSRSYCSVKCNSGRQASLCFSVQVFFLDFHLQYNSVLRAKIIMFQHLHLYYVDETRMLCCLCQITSFPPHYNDGLDKGNTLPEMRSLWFHI